MELKLFIALATTVSLQVLIVLYGIETAILLCNQVLTLSLNRTLWN